MKKLVGPFMFLFWIVRLGTAQEVHINRIILSEGQKIFLERADYMNDKIYRVTDKVDTVEVVLADQAFYKFKKNEFYAWGLLSQVKNEDILPNEYLGEDPVAVSTDRPTSVYKEGIMGSDRLIELKKNVPVTVIRKVHLFYEIEFGKGERGFVVTTAIPGPERMVNKSHIIRDAKAGIGSGSGFGSSSDNSVQCSGSTKKGSRCKNMTTNASGRCHLH